MAPEQAMAKDIGAWTDLYSVGCISYELFTGRPPFVDAEEPMAIMLRHVTEPLPPAADGGGRRSGDLGVDRAAGGEEAGGPAAVGDAPRGRTSRRS